MCCNPNVEDLCCGPNTYLYCAPNPAYVFMCRQAKTMWFGHLSSLHGHRFVVAVAAVLWLGIAQHGILHSDSRQHWIAGCNRHCSKVSVMVMGICNDLMQLSAHAALINVGRSSPDIFHKSGQMSACNPVLHPTPHCIGRCQPLQSTPPGTHRSSDVGQPPT